MRRIMLMMLLLVSSLNTVLHAQTTDLPAVALCDDGRQIVGYGLRFDDLTPNTNVRVTVLGAGDFDPAFAVVDREGGFQCTNNSMGAEGTTIAIPGLGRVEYNSFAAQRTILIDNSGELNLVVGGFPGQSGQFGVVVENLRIDNPTEVDNLYIKVPVSATKEWLNVFMIARTNNLDPATALYVENDVRPKRECDNAGTRTCEGIPTLTERGAVISTADIYAADSFDAGVMGAFQAENLRVEFKDVTGTNSGEYIAVFAATATGAVVDTSFVCDNVILSVDGASPSYNSTYITDYLIDGDPSTFWVTGAAPYDPQTGQRGSASFVVLKVDPDREIHKIRINGYAQSADEFASNALQKFALRFQNESEELVTAVEAELLQQPGYQSFSFVPAKIDEVGLILIENYGGTLFTVVDVEICALP